MNDFVFNILPMQGPLIPQEIPIIGGMPASSFAGSFLGVFLAILLGVIIDSLRKDSRRFKHWTMFNKEIKNGIEIIDTNKTLLPGCNSLNEPYPRNNLPSPIPTSNWSSSINSGALSIFPIECVSELTRVYNLVEGYNGEICRYLNLKLDRMVIVNSRPGSCLSTLRNYEERILPAYGDEIRPEMVAFQKILATKSAKRRYIIWRYIL